MIVSLAELLRGVIIHIYTNSYCPTCLVLDVHVCGLFVVCVFWVVCVQYFKNKHLYLIWVFCAQI